MNQDHSRQLFEEARNYLPGGVDSPVRAYNAVGGTPPFIVKGKGSKIYDADGNWYIDYVCSWGPLILGHAHPDVVKALKNAIDRGTSFGAPTELEVELAKVICRAMPSMEMMRFVNSGTEAVMTALRLARAFTGRNKILKFSGCYHGHADSLLVKAGSGLATLDIPYSAGVTSGCVEDTLVVQYNNIEQVTEIFKMQGESIAAVIVEPVAANMGVVLPVPGFLEKLREITQRCGSLLIFDEVITGFRIGYGGVQAKYGIKPDLTCLGKIIGGGLPVGAFGGRRDIMQMLSPLGPVYQAGTLSGNPLAMTAGLKTLKVLRQGGIYDLLEARAGKLVKGISEAAAERKINAVVSHCSSLLTVFFADKPVTDYESALLTDTSRFATFFQSLLAQGIYWPPSQFEAAFISTAHSDDDVGKTVKCCDIAFKRMAAG